MYKFSLPFDRLPPDPHVEGDHDADGGEEGDHDRHNRHVLVAVDKLDVAVVLRNLPLALDVRPSDDPRRPDDGRDGPRREDHQGSLPRRPARAIRQGPRDGEVPIEADHQQVQDTGIGRQVVHGQPDVADDLTEAPFLLQDEDGEQGHADGPDDDVSHGQ